MLALCVGGQIVCLVLREVNVVTETGELRFKDLSAAVSHVPIRTLPLHAAVSVIKPSMCLSGVVR